MQISLIVAVAAFAGFSLGLPTEASEVHKLAARAQCDFRSPANVGDANSCADYLIGLDTATCASNQDPNILCQSGTAYVFGQAQNVDSTSSYCRDVGYAVRNIISTCTYDGQVTGYEAAGGNGNYLISLGGNA